MSTLAEHTEAERAEFLVGAGILQRRLQSVVREMGIALLRTTRSSTLFEAKDFGTALFDARGGFLESRQYMPMHAFSLPPGLKEAMRIYGDDIAPGDAIMHNDVFTGGNQYNDVSIYKPVFVGDELVGWAGVKGHQEDIGGPVSGGMNSRAVEAWQEALIVPPVKLVVAGRDNKDLWRLIFRNVRLRDQVESDIRAQIGACTVGERRLRELVQRYGRDDYQAMITELTDGAERAMRAQIADIPDGEYVGRAMVHDAPNAGDEALVMVTVRVEGADITFDFTGTDAQLPGFTNMPLAATEAGCLLGFLMLVGADMPLNQGMLRPVHYVIPAGTLLNPAFPAATGFGMPLADHVCDAIFKALAEPLRDRVGAGWSHVGTYCTGRTPRDGSRFVSIFFFANKGGSGGTEGVDGFDHIGSIRAGGSLEAEDNEMFEVAHPYFRLRKHEFLADSAGPGEWRGGLGIETVLEMNGVDQSLVAYSDRLAEPAWGLFGGKESIVSRMEVTQPDGTVRRSRSKDNIDHIPPGSVFHKWTGGGGGFGDPRRRSLDAVVDDVRNGVVSVASARDDYGVVVDPTTFEVDADATAVLRAGRHDGGGTP
ncbi:MAG: hydantoinase B/oxoprolinase family protein [Acidimicrobiales bacterium]